MAKSRGAGNQTHAVGSTRWNVAMLPKARPLRTAFPVRDMRQQRDKTRLVWSCLPNEVQIERVSRRQVSEFPVSSFSTRAIRPEHSAALDAICTCHNNASEEESCMNDRILTNLWFTVLGQRGPVGAADQERILSAIWAQRPNASNSMGAEKLSPFRGRLPLDVHTLAHALHSCVLSSTGTTAVCGGPTSHPEPVSAWASTLFSNVFDPARHALENRWYKLSLLSYHSLLNTVARNAAVPAFKIAAGTSLQTLNGNGLDVDWTVVLVLSMLEVQFVVGHSGDQSRQVISCDSNDNQPSSHAGILIRQLWKLWKGIRPTSRPPFVTVSIVTSFLRLARLVSDSPLVAGIWRYCLNENMLRLDSGPQTTALILQYLLARVSVECPGVHICRDPSHATSHGPISPLPHVADDLLDDIPPQASKSFILGCMMRHLTLRDVDRAFALYCAFGGRMNDNGRPYLTERSVFGLAIQLAKSPERLGMALVLLARYALPTSSTPSMLRRFLLDAKIGGHPHFLPGSLPLARLRTLLEAILSLWRTNPAVRLRYIQIIVLTESYVALFSHARPNTPSLGPSNCATNAVRAASSTCVAPQAPVCPPSNPLTSRQFQSCSVANFHFLIGTLIVSGHARQAIDIFEAFGPSLLISSPPTPGAPQPFRPLFIRRVLRLLLRHRQFSQAVRLLTLLDGVNTANVKGSAAEERRRAQMIGSLRRKLLRGLARGGAIKLARQVWRATHVPDKKDRLTASYRAVGFDFNHPSRVATLRAVQILRRMRRSVGGVREPLPPTVVRTELEFLVNAQRQRAARLLLTRVCKDPGFDAKFKTVLCNLVLHGAARGYPGIARQSPRTGARRGTEVSHASRGLPKGPRRKKIVGTRRRNRLLVQHVLHMRRWLIQHVGFTPDWVTTNIVLKVLLAWKGGNSPQDSADVQTATRNEVHAPPHVVAQKRGARALRQKTWMLDSGQVKGMFDDLIRGGFCSDVVGGPLFGTTPATGSQTSSQKTDAAFDTENRALRATSFNRHVRPTLKMFIKAFHVRGDAAAAHVVVRILKMAQVADVEEKSRRHAARMAGRFKKCRSLETQRGCIEEP
ncbi:hypothetical protein FISHEDRAFT_56454 [Fistulina hepatica ATCC 64428]|uniref:Uncharacterized protein n=1 Tax=Fistulina hepatica ATCC 64428 TaxID=1128425 RepID=A0A0D7AJN8_9AGAR|nr:hypothetical protein FISHEDRAFT_56454 [Fistulina hepatica ATCC 64428]